jgi:hypothetical protein
MILSKKHDFSLTLSYKVRKVREQVSSKYNYNVKIPEGLYYSTQKVVNQCLLNRGFHKIKITGFIFDPHS